MKITRVSSEHLEVEKLPDGSTVIFDSSSKTVYSLNETAAAAWVACQENLSLPEIVDAMRRSLRSTVTEEIAMEGLYQLQDKGLIAIEASGLTRRSLAATAAGVMAPLVLALTSTEQRAFAQVAGSGTTTTTTTTTTSTTTTTTTSSPRTTANPAIRRRS
jgi:hypothetical protein